MATEIIKQLVDDIDGGTAVSTISFTWQGQAYELDLNKKNSTAFEKAIRPYLDHARRVRGAKATGSRTTRRSAASASSRLADVRDWGRANGYQVSDRGRVPAALLEAYDAAN